jgi:clan AA aspartic protease
MNVGAESDRFPYIRLQVEVRGHRHDVEALIDTGFDGFMAVPPELLANGQPADDYYSWTLADGSRVVTPVYLGTVQIGDLAEVPAVIAALGDEPLIGRRVTDKFRVIFDHGKRVIVEP